MHVVIITGISGAGKSTALSAFEDMGYEAVDNLPLSMVPLLCTASYEEAELYLPENIVVGVDVRNRDFSPERLQQVADFLKSRHHVDLDIVVLDCDDATIIRRYSETRRRHPLAKDRPITDGIAEERALISPLLKMADHHLDTSDFRVAELKQALHSVFFSKDAQPLTLSVLSFSYAYGVPRNADLMLDVRFLQNPHYVAALKDHTGQHADVQKYIHTDPAYAPFSSQIQQMLSLLLPRYLLEGKSYLTIAFGCTGGKHRSVCMAEECGRWLQEQGHDVTIRHRDMPTY